MNFDELVCSLRPPTPMTTLRVANLVEGGTTTASDLGAGG